MNPCVSSSCDFDLIRRAGGHAEHRGAAAALEFWGVRIEVNMTTLSYCTVQVATLSTAELLRGAWRQRCLLLVMPGGADLPYCRHLNGAGNRLIAGGASSQTWYLLKDGVHLPYCWHLNGAGNRLICSGPLVFMLKPGSWLKQHIIWQRAGGTVRHAAVRCGRRRLCASAAFVGVRRCHLPL